MPIAALTAASAAVTAGATIYASNKSSKAANTAGNLEAQAAADARAEQQREFDAIQANNAPARQIGTASMQALGGAFGLPGYGGVSMTGQRVASTPVPNVGGVSMTDPQVKQMGGARPTPTVLGGGGDGGSPAGPVGPQRVSGPDTATPDAAAGGVDWMQYLRDNPDAMANYEEIHASGRTDQLANDPIAFAQYHYQGDGARRALPMLAAQPTAPAAPTMTGDGGYQAPPGYSDPTAPSGYGVGARPDAGAAPVRMTDTPLDVSLGAYQRSPDYNFRLQQGQNALDHVASSMGGIMSGARLKAADRYNQDYATTDYNDWRNYTTGQYNTNRSVGDARYGVDLSQYDNTRARSDGLYADDRAFTTGRYDTRNNQLMSLAGFGQAATNATNQAGQTFAQNAGNLAMTGAQAQGNAAINGANAFTSGINNLLTTGAYIGGKFIGSGYGVNPATSAAPISGAMTSIAPAGGWDTGFIGGGSW